MEKLINKAATLIEALPYFQEFRNSIVVIKFGGSAMEKHDLIHKTMRDIVFMECIGMKPVVVHGGGKAITTKLAELNIETKFVNGLRHTCKKTLGVVDNVLHEVSDHLLAGIEEVEGKGQALSGRKILTAKKLFSECPDSGNPIDIGFVGEITQVDTKPIIELTEQDIVPVIAPLATGTDHETYNINADIAACRIAEALQARKLVFLSDVPGILGKADDENSLISTVHVSEVDNLIESKIIGGGMVPKIKSAIHALESGTNKVHMIDGRIPHSLLLEIFTDQGIGTQIIKH